MIRRQRRDAAPVVHPGGDKRRQSPRAQVGRRLHAHIRPQNQARHGDGPAQFFVVRLRSRGHQGAGLGAKVLDDHFLNMPIAGVQATNRKQVLPRIAQQALGRSVARRPYRQALRPHQGQALGPFPLQQHGACRQGVRARHVGNAQTIAAAIALPHAVPQGLQAIAADGVTDDTIAPGPAHAVGDDHRDVAAKSGTERQGELTRAAIRVPRPEQNLGIARALHDIRSVDSRVGEDMAAVVLGEQPGPGVNEPGF